MLGELAALGSAAFWALATVLVKTPTRRLGALYVTSVRALFASGLVVILVAGVGQLTDIAEIPASEIAMLLGASMIAVTGDILFVRAVAMHDLSRVFPVTTGLFILISFVGSVVIINEPMKWYAPLGGVLVLAGVYLIALSRRAVPSSSESGAQGPGGGSFGLALATLTATLWSVSLLLTDYAMQAAEPLPAAALRIPFTTIVMLGLAFARGDIRRGRLNRKDLAALVVSGLLVGGSAILFTFAVKQSSAGLISILSSSSPLFAVPIAWLFLREPVTRRILAGTAICMAGVVLTMI